MTFKKILLGLPFFVLANCIEERNFDLPSEGPRIVVDGLITSTKTGSYVTIGWSSNVNSFCTDIFGNPTTCQNGPDTGIFNLTGTVSVFQDNQQIVSNPFKMNDKRYQFYMKLDIVGTVGSKYRLEIDIDYNGSPEHYTAEAVMQATPKITDITYVIRQGDIGKSDNIVPLISFKEPPGRNFYLFKLCTTNGGFASCGNDRVWPYSIIADTFLPADVTGLSIDDGASVAKYIEFYPHPEPNLAIQVKMFSVDETTFFFYKALIDQFNNDGGAYSPTPVTARGNISNNGIGLFRALDESNATVVY